MLKTHGTAGLYPPKKYIHGVYSGIARKKLILLTWAVFYRLWTNLASRNICRHEKYLLQLSFYNYNNTIISKPGINMKNNSIHKVRTTAVSSERREAYIHPD